MQRLHNCCLTFAPKLARSLEKDHKDERDRYKEIAERFTSDIYNHITLSPPSQITDNYYYELSQKIERLGSVINDWITLEVTIRNFIKSGKKLAETGVKSYIYPVLSAVATIGCWIADQFYGKDGESTIDNSPNANIAPTTLATDSSSDPTVNPFPLLTGIGWIILGGSSAVVKVIDDQKKILKDRIDQLKEVVKEDKKTFEAYQGVWQLFKIVSFYQKGMRSTSPRSKSSPHFISFPVSRKSSTQDVGRDAEQHLELPSRNSQERSIPIEEDRSFSLDGHVREENFVQKWIEYMHKVKKGKILSEKKLDKLRACIVNTTAFQLDRQSFERDLQEEQQHEEERKDDWEIEIQLPEDTQKAITYLRTLEAVNYIEDTVQDH